MTAKEQAVELTREFFPIVNGGETYNIILSKAKKGALITVAQILKSNPTKIDCNSSELNYGYWVEVKKEIENL